MNSILALEKVTRIEGAIQIDCVMTFSMETYPFITRGRICKQYSTILICSKSQNLLLARTTQTTSRIVLQLEFLRESLRDSTGSIPFQEP